VDHLWTQDIFLGYTSLSAIGLYPILLGITQFIAAYLWTKSYLVPKIYLALAQARAYISGPISPTGLICPISPTGLISPNWAT
jgi:hypothetical protein